jgi:hypothetical protein
MGRAAAVLMCLALCGPAWGLRAQDAQTRRVEGLSFTGVIVLGNSRVEISQGEDHELLLYGDERDLDTEPFHIGRGDVLVLGRSRSGARANLRYRVVMPNLERVVVKDSGTAFIKAFRLEDSGDRPSFLVDGSGDLRLYGLEGPAAELRVKGSGDIKAVRVAVDNLEAVVSGSGDLYMREVQADYAEFVVAGSGDLKVTEAGYVRELEANVVGSGDARLEAVACDEADVNIVGSGSASLGIVERYLSVSIVGSGDVRYGGDPEVERTVFGSGDVRRRD